MLGRNLVRWQYLLLHQQHLDDWRHQPQPNTVGQPWALMAQSKPVILTVVRIEFINIFYLQMHRTRPQSGFTLLEILLTIAILAILAAVILVAMNPVHQMSQARDEQRKNDVSELHKAVQQYLIDKGSYPANVADDSTVYGICSAQTYSQGLDDSVVCGDLVNLARVIPVYLGGIPMDPVSPRFGIDTMYKIALSKTTGIYVEASKTEVGQGDAKTVIYVGKPPRGYVIPIITQVVGTTTVSTFISNVSEDVAGWPAWIGQVIILIIGVAIGYYYGKHAKAAKPKKKPQQDSSDQQPSPQQNP